MAAPLAPLQRGRNSCPIEILTSEEVKALIRAREEFKGVVEMQVVAFAQDGLIREVGAAELLAEAMELGADVVGGIPWIEYTDADMAEHVRLVFDLAERYDKPVSMLVDDAGDPSPSAGDVSARTTVQVLAGGMVVDEESGLNFTNTAGLQFEADRLILTSGTQRDPGNGALDVRDGDTIQDQSIGFEL